MAKTKEQTQPYKLQGFGSTAKKANSDLTRVQRSLVDKLKDAKVSTNVSGHTDHYLAEYTAKQSVAEELDCPEFKVQSNKSWDRIRTLAEKRANGNGLDSYDTRMTVTRTYQLTDKQMDAATRVKLRLTGAENSSPRDSYLTSLINR